MNDKGKTKIPYVTQTWETVGGCTKCSIGCKNCYAIPMVGNRFSKNPRYDGLVKGKKENQNWTGKVKLYEDRLEQPLPWTAPRTIFVNPRSDTFHPSVPFEFVCKMFENIANAGQHKYLILTKRPEIMKSFFQSCEDWDSIEWPNVYLGTTICNQAEADKNIPILLQIPAAKRWLSIEPMLGPVQLPFCGWDGIGMCPHCGYEHGVHNPLAGFPDGILPQENIDWVVVGCESGPNRRPCKIEDMISVVNQCQAAGVPVYVKQVDLNGKAEKDINKFPAQLQVRDEI